MKKIILQLVLFLGSIAVQAQVLSIINPRVEYKTNPLGMDVQQPRFSWELQSTANDVMQTAWQIRVAASEKDLIRAKNLLWDSGKMASDQSNQIVYQGPALSSKSRYFWQVRTWDNHGASSVWSPVAHWEMGLLQSSDWVAEWITIAEEEDVSVSQPVHLLRKNFVAEKRPIAARLYISALGLYEAEINGKKVGDELFTPGWTAYKKRLHYQTYDVTNLLNSGQNTIGVSLADGWFRGDIGFEDQRNFYGEKRALIAQLELTYANGKKEMIVSDATWKAGTGPILMSEIYHGETYDARLEKPTWSTPLFTDTNWKGTKILNHAKDILVAPLGPPVKTMEVLDSKEIIKTPKGETVFDLGQNMVGRIRLKVQGKAGDTIKIYHAEVLDEMGNFYTENLRAAKQKITYILKGGGEEIYEPFFSFMGFRYVKVEGIVQPTLDNINAVVIHSDLPIAGEFSCSNPLINQLQQNIRWGQKGNFLDVPTDCPQRDERLGWTGDAQAFSRTAMYNMDVASFFTKWLADLEADQKADGMVPFVVPNVLGENAGASAGWADASTIIPWDMYLAYGDKNILVQQYESMKAWVGYMEEKAGESYLWNTGFHFGDWLFYSVNDDRDGKSAITDKYLIAQCFFAHSADIMQKTATLLGKTADAKYYKELSEKVKAAFIKEYVTPNGRLASPTQTAYVLALNFDMLPAAMRPAAVKRLVDNIKGYKNHLTTGFLGTPYLCHVLTRFGHRDLAYTLLEREQYPSWLYPITKGATTIWERWDGIKPDGSFQSASMNSFNHYAYGAIGDWMYRVVAGIDIDEANPGYKHILLHPQPGGTLSQVTASHHSLYGDIKSAWVWLNGQLNVEVSIPANTTATLKLPSTNSAGVSTQGSPLKEGQGIHRIEQTGEDLSIKLGSGRYSFTYSLAGR